MTGESRVRRTCRLFAGLAAATMLLCAAGEAGEHRVVDEYQLSHLSTSVTHTPSWYQYEIDSYHPIGCGPLSWTMVYAYWHQFKGKSALFPTAPSGNDRGGATSSGVTDVGNDVAAATSTTHGQAGSQVFGRTWTKDMCSGIDYAKARGYGESRCFKIIGPEFDKFERIKEYIRTDRPVILNINHEGLGILDHYVVIEGTRKRQELVAGKWRDRDVEYLANFGWSEAGGSRWISVRQVGANSGTVYTSAAAFLIDVSGTPLPEASSANEAACKDWCRENSGACSMCSRLAGCGPGYETIKSFTEAGTNWYACSKKDTHRSDASEQNRLDCEQWCASHREDEGCVKCDTRLGCGDGYINLKSWTGYGNNWHACRREGESARDQASDRNHADCETWCDANKPSCVECSKKAGCGVGLEPLKSWTGFGDNWKACGKSHWGAHSEQNQAACEAYCEANKPQCVECRASVGCGAHQTAIKMFDGEGGKNWYACRHASSASNKEACEIWCNAHKPECVFCSKKDFCGLHYKRMELFRGPGENYAACKRD